ncbi:hypothetical protein Tco_0739801 [Tanacetum coccineum]
MSIRGQILADFIAERPDEEGPSIEPEEGEEFTYALRFKFDASNNEAEYETLIDGLWIAEQIGTLPAKTKKARAIKIKARQYTMINDVLYKKSFLEPWLRCVGPIQVEYVVKEIYEGSCSMHSGLRFRLPGEIISDNEKQFRDNPFKV